MTAPAWVDPTGRLVTYTRDAAAVAAITSRSRGGEKAAGDAAPRIVVVTMPAVPWVGSPDTQRTGVATWRHAFRCYGRRRQEGAREAVELGGAVAGVLHGAGPITFPAPGGGGTAGIYQIHVEGMSQVLMDPDTSEPYVIVTTVLSATAHAIA